MRGRFLKISGNLFGKRQVIADKYFSALGHSIAVLSYFLVEEGPGDYLASIFNAFL